MADPNPSRETVPGAHRTFLNGLDSPSAIRQPASGADPIFQSPKAAKLGTAVEGETLAGEGRQG